ncbi:hypothetical protein, partial [Enterococcus faecalis]|uniref:hypothetical protein n=1 Tax=Enterococcus faecalis TaxID=1351 RepID=UPI00403F21F1
RRDEDKECRMRSQQIEEIFPGGSFGHRRFLLFSDFSSLSHLHIHILSEQSVLCTVICLLSSVSSVGIIITNMF